MVRLEPELVHLGADRLEHRKRRDEILPLEYAPPIALRRGPVRSKPP